MSQGMEGIRERNALNAEIIRYFGLTYKNERREYVSTRRKRQARTLPRFFRMSVVLETSQAVVETKFKCPLCHSNKWKLTLRQIDVQQQLNNCDCHVFAIAFALLLLLLSASDKSLTSSTISIQ